ncbi:MAG: hypoxanthine phosphoribosyltransferase [Porticoccaceae bacterium]|nr:MAG: hypoxanthine phosphoribosyltransferase [Porticoccaceae bacterium]
MDSQDKLFLSADRLLDDAFQLGFRVLASGYVPDLVIALWRGGAPVGVAISELFRYRGLAHDALPLATRHYAAPEQPAGRVEIFGLEALSGRLAEAQKILVVDDVFDTGLTVQAVLAALSDAAGSARPEIRTATLWYKPSRNRTELAPDYFLHLTERWIVFPHELEGLTPAEIRAGKPELPALRDL